MSWIVGSRFNTRGSGLVGSLGTDGQVFTSSGAGAGAVFEAASVANDAITLAKMASGTDGNIISYDASGNPVAIATGSDGQVLTSTGAGSPPAFEAAGGGDNTPVFAVSKSGSQDTTNGAYTLITWDVEAVDTDSTFASNKFVAPSDGTYYFNAHILSHTGTTTTTFTSFYKNGSNFRFTRYYNNRDTYTTEIAVLITTLSADDYIEVYHYTDQGAAGTRYTYGNDTELLGSTFYGFKLIT